MMYRTLCAVTALSLVSLLWACDDDPSSGVDDPVDTVDDQTRERDLFTEPDTSSVGDVQEEAVEDILEADTVDEPLPLSETSCVNEIDDDGDTFIDCADPDCADECEICNDITDNDGDGLVDCADPDCSDHETCPERCQNDADDDADGLVDCADEECADSGRCQEDPMPIESYEFAEMGYFSRLQYPPPGVACCFDFDDDPALDNQLPSLLQAIPGYDAQWNMDAVVNNGELALLIEWRQFPDTFADGGLVNFNIMRGLPMSPASIGPEYNAWDNGLGIFRVTPDSFDERGPRIRFEDNDFDAGLLLGGPHFLNLSIPIPELGLALALTVYQARVEMHLAEVGSGETRQLQTVPQQVAGTGGQVTVGGGKLGGYVRADDLFAFFNDGADLCNCARPPAAVGPLLDYGERPDPEYRYLVSCNWDPLSPTSPGYACTQYHSPMCAYLGEICLVTGLVPLMLDIDANKNEINESISVGLYFDIVGAQLDDPPVVGE